MRATAVDSRARVRRVLVVGAGKRFLSGITVYTIRLANALAPSHRVSMIPIRQLLPTALYPGRRRVGADLSGLDVAPGVTAFEGVDWFWMPSLLRAALFMIRRRPDVLVFQWWTATVLHTYLALAILGRMAGARIVVEFHETLDTGEARIGAVRAYVSLLAPLFIALSSGFVVHSDHDRAELEQRYRLRGRPVRLIPHGPYEHYRDGADTPVLRDAPADAFNLLFFGIIRPFKGLEDLIRAFEAIPDDEADRYWLTVVGETWEGWDLPAQMIAASPRRDRITFVNRYVRDDELDGFVRGADAVVLPYHRSSMSGPLNVAMAYGLPVVVTAVGGLVEAVEAYEGAVLVPPHDPERLRAGLDAARALGSRRFEHPSSWARTAAAYDELFATVEAAHAR
jgi:glycosyltransferase involved in cell wall biosynthesis